MIGRAPELTRLAELIDAARAGRGGSLALRGEPGIGKTALLGWARRRAAGSRILAATGAEGESGLAFAALASVLRPVLGLRLRLPPARRAALESALALGPPALPFRFAAYTGAFALVEAACAAGPVVVLVDDAHWLDAPSAEAIAFVCRRLEDLPLAVVLALRPSEGSDAAAAASPSLEVPPLADDEARDMLAVRAGAGLAAAVAERVLSVAAGNPLALSELPRALTPAERSGEVALPASIRVGTVLSTAYRRRLDPLDEEARRGLLVVAAAGDEEPGHVLRACAARGCSRAALERAEAAGVLVLAPGRIALTHPLMGAVALALAGPAEARAAHRALAEALGPGSGERRAWHLAHAAVGADADAAAELEEVAGAAAARTAFATAADAMARAAELSPDGEVRAGRLLRAARLARLSGRSRMSAGLLERAAAGARDPPLRAEIDHQRGLARIDAGHAGEGVRLLLETAGEVAGHSPARAATMLADAALAWGLAGRSAVSLAACERARALGPLPPEARARLDVATAYALLFAGRGREARALAGGLDAVVAALDPLSDDHHAVLYGIVVHMCLGRFAVARRESERAVAACRRGGVLGLLASHLATRAELAFRQSDWADGIAAAGEGARAAEETGQAPVAAYALSVLARLEGAMGLEERCRRHLAVSDRLARRAGAASLVVLNGHARGLMELGAGRPAEAIAALEPVAARWGAQRARCAEMVRWRQDLVEAYARAGDLAAARRHLRALREEAVMAGTAATHALVARGRALVDPADERHFATALALHARVPIPFDVARTRLLYGERLRRDRRRGRAREQLAAALAGFEELGARPWAERARAELAAAGVPAGEAPVAGVERLTPRELQVALIVARGATNREAARALFLSEKTVERHLSAVYPKLGVRSRTELARMLARADP